MSRRPGRGRAPTPGSSRDRGMVTAELAVALPAVVLVLALGLGAVAAMTTQLQCADAAQVAARLAARGEPAATAVAAARAVAPAGATVSLRPGGASTVTVVVAAPVRLPGLGRWLTPMSVRQRFTEPTEPGVDAEQAER